MKGWPPGGLFAGCTGKRRTMPFSFFEKRSKTYGQHVNIVLKNYGDDSIAEHNPMRNKILHGVQLNYGIKEHSLHKPVTFMREYLKKVDYNIL